MIALIVSIVALLAAIGSLLYIKRNWLTLARTELVLARTDRSLAESFQRVDPARSAERLAAAERHEALAVKYRRRAWPWRGVVEEDRNGQ